MIEGDGKNGIRQPPPKRFIIHELLEQLRIVFEHGRHHPCQRLVVFDAGVLLVGILPGILIGRIGRDAVRDIDGDQLVNPVDIAPGNVAEMLVEGLEDVGEPVQLGLGLAAAGRNGCDLRIGVWQLNAGGSLFFDAVTVHVDRFQDAL